MIGIEVEEDKLATVKKVAWEFPIKIKIIESPFSTNKYIIEPKGRNGKVDQFLNLVQETALFPQKCWRSKLMLIHFSAILNGKE